MFGAGVGHPKGRRRAPDRSWSLALWRWDPRWFLARREHEFGNEAGVDEVLCIVVRVERYFASPPIDRHELGMIDREGASIDKHQVKRPKRLTADCLPKLVERHFTPPVRRARYSVKAILAARISI